MSQSERTELIKVLKAKSEELQKDKTASHKFLVSAGILTEKGDLQKPYKNLCVQPSQH